MGKIIDRIRERESLRIEKLREAAFQELLRREMFRSGAVIRVPEGEFLKPPWWKFWK
jgi:hypothetical protein